MLDEDFYRALRDHPVPVSESRPSRHRAPILVIDVYIWLAYRLHALKRDVEVGWPSLYAQFGAESAGSEASGSIFIECLALALAAYPDARVEVGERGVILRPSRPAIAKA